MIAHWPLEGNPNDEAYGNYNGTEIGGVSYGDGILGDCYDNTSGSGTGIQLMPNTDAEKFDTVFSWSLWFKSTTTSGNSVARILSRDYQLLAVMCDQTQSGNQDIILSNGPNGSAQVNEWHHLAVTYNSNVTVELYIDGVSQGTASGATYNNRPWVIGGNTEGDGDISGNHFEGKIDDCRFYDHVLSKAEVKELAQGKVGHWDFEDLGEIETFDEQRSGLGWDVTNAYIQNTSKIGNYSIGSFGNGETRMTWEPKGLEGGKQIQSFSYWWQEDSSQTGHAVRLFDSSGNEVQESGTENPQWYLNDGSGRYQEYGGDNYNVWTLFSFSFDWSAGTYDFYLRDSQSGTTRTGTNNLQNATNVERIEFNGDGYGSANYNRFDGISFAYQTVKDSTVQKNNGNVQGDLQIRSGKIGEHSASFDGVDDQIITQDSYSFGSDPWTVCAWYYPQASDDYGHILTSASSQGDFACKVATGSDNLEPYFFNNRVNTFGGSGSLSIGSWFFLTYVYDGSEVRVYKNASQISSASANLNIPERQFVVQGGNGEHVKAIHDDTRIYKTALSQSQIQSIYQAKARLTDNHRFFNQSIQESGHRGRFTDYTVWDIGTNGSQGDFSRNGGTSENEIVRGTGPHGKFSALWKCIPDSGDDADGGWNHNFQGDNSTRLRMSTFFRRNNSTNGVTYHGCDNSGNTLNLDGSTDGNPYFWNGDPPNLDEWYLAVGILHPNGYTGGQTGISGVYDMDGNQVRGGTDYKWGTGSRQELRNYLYYSTNTSERQYFAYPRVEVVDGTEPSIEALLEGIDAKSEDYVQNLQNAKGPVGMSVQSNRTVISSINEVGPAADSLVGWWKLNGNLKDFAGKNDGTNNGANVVDGYGQTAYDFEESNADYINLGVVDNRFALGRGDFTFSAWVNFESVQNNATIFELSRYTDALLVRPTNDNGGEIEIYMDNQNNTTRTFQPGIDDTTGVWTQFVVTRRSGTVEVFQDASSLGTQAMDGVFEINQDSYIGTSVHSPSDQNHDGKMQDVRFYDTGMTAEQVQVLYEMSKPDAKMKKRPEGFYAPQFSETQL